MKTILIIGFVFLALVALVILGTWLKGKLLKRLIHERDNLDLRTPEGKNRAKVLNKRIDRIYGYKG